MVQRRLCLIIEIQIMTTLLPPVHPFNWAKRMGLVLELGFSLWTWIRKMPADQRLFTSMFNLLPLRKVKKTTPKEVQNMIEFAQGHVTSWYGYWISQLYSPAFHASQDCILRLALEPKISTRGGHHAVLSLSQSLKLFSGKDAKFYIVNDRRRRILWLWHGEIHEKTKREKTWRCKWEAATQDEIRFSWMVGYKSDMKITWIKSCCCFLPCGSYKVPALQNRVIILIIWLCCKSFYFRFPFNCKVSIHF